MASIAVVWLPGALTWPPTPPGWGVTCTDHGTLPMRWTEPLWATWNAIGHASAHHPPKGLRSPHAPDDPPHP